MPPLQLHPYVAPELRDYIVEAYVDIRAKDKQRSIENNSRATTTARQLLSILRLAEAHAKLKVREKVQQVDVDEAIRLIQMSKASVMESDGDLSRGARFDPVSRIWDLVKEKLNVKPNFGECARQAGRQGRQAAAAAAAAAASLSSHPLFPLPSLSSTSPPVGFEDALNLAQRAGFSRDDFDRFLAEYESLSVIQVNPSRTRIDLAESGL